MIHVYKRLPLTKRSVVTMSDTGRRSNLGPQVSFIYRDGMRYEGILKTMNEHTVTLVNVRLFGIEDRPTTKRVGPRLVFEEFAFNSSLIKDWRVHETPMPQQIDANATVNKFAVELSENFANYCCSKELSDLQIKCQDKTFDAHQVILSARSPVFKRMLESDMVEKNSRVVEIKQLNSNIVEEMLKFIYTGKCKVNDANIDPQIVKQLFEAANMYQLDSLKAFCGDILISSLVPDNALSLLLLGDMHSAEELKKHAMGTVINNLKTIRRSDEWKDCIKERPDISAEITEAMADKLETMHI